MTQPEISVIVPIYNVEKYLDKCVQSIRNQTFTDLEIILVDDGSPDRCGEMCDAYAREDLRIRVIHKENGGLSDARNAGIDAARGKYLGFVDSDDYIEADMYEMLHSMIVQENADVAICGVYDHYATSVNSSDTSTDFTIRVLNTEEVIALTLNGLAVSSCTKLYKKGLFSQLKFPIGKNWEDAHIMIYLLDRTKRAAVTDIKKYHYIHRERSITTLAYHPQVLSAIEAWEKNFTFIKEHYPKLIPLAECRYLWANFYVLDRMMLAPEKSDIKKQHEIVQLLRKNIWNILKNPGFQKSRKIAALCLLVSQRLYRQCALVYWRKHQAIT